MPAVQAAVVIAPANVVMTVSASASYFLSLAVLYGAFQTAFRTLVSPFTAWTANDLLGFEDPGFIAHGNLPVVNNNSYRPVVFWHGMGDSCCDDRSVGGLANLIREDLPSVFVYSLRFGNGPDPTPDDDVRASYFGQVNDQVREACKELAGMKELRDGFNAVGFSQGGQFLRAYVQRCNDPPVQNLITFGAQHAGISDLPNCEGSSSSWCKLAFNLARHGAYLPFVQTKVVQAQYFKDPTNIPAYLSRNIFLPDINNENPESRKPEYRERLVTLNKFVMIKFTRDRIVVPRNSSWFGFVKYEDGILVPEPLQESNLYKEDWLGLRELDERGKLVFLNVPGAHMQIDVKFFREMVVGPYLAEPIG